MFVSNIDQQDRADDDARGFSSGEIARRVSLYDKETEKK